MLFHSKPGRTVHLLLILLAALGVRVAAAIKWHQDTIESNRMLRLGDSDSYWILAGHIARGEPYQYGSPDASIFRSPGYPLILAPFTLFPEQLTGIFWARIFGCVCGTLAVWLVIQLASRLVTRGLMASETIHLYRWVPSQALPGSALVAGWIAAIYPGAIGMSIVILSEAVFCPLMLLTLWHWHTALSLASWRDAWPAAIWAGACAGLAILCRPSWLLFMPFAGIVLLAIHPRRLHQFMVLATMAVGCAGIMSPWWIRNASITSRFVPTTLQVGASLYDGLHENASGGSDEDMQFVNRFVEEQRAADEQLRQASPTGQIDIWEHSSFEYRLNARHQRAALDWAKKNISGAFRLSLLKFAKTWSLWPSAGEVGSTGLRLALTLTCFGVLLLAIGTGLRCFHGSVAPSPVDGWLVVLCFLPTVYFTLLHMVFVGSIRYREPAVLLLTVLSGSALCAISSRNQHRQGCQSIEPSVDQQNT